MIEQTIIHHHIQKHIIDVLMFHEHTRFRDMKPPGVDTNLFTYHLKILLKLGFIDKRDSSYTLSTAGLSYVDRVSSQNITLRQQPKVITMMVVQNSDGDILLWQRKRQPFINAWTLPYGKLHIDDMSIELAAKREIKEKISEQQYDIVHAGDCYIRVTSGDQSVSTTLAHVFKFETDDISENDRLKWVRPHKLNQYYLAPAVESIVARSFFNDDHFFEEFDETWTVAVKNS
jgi:ADP-ribose pyrophosphatase YjhB (NUDIX family)